LGAFTRAQFSVDYTISLIYDRDSGWSSNLESIITMF
jgi:hypothetical protein